MTSLGRRAVAAVERAYRASGADRPFGDPLPAHGVAMEGYFWRFTDSATGRVVIALNGVNRADDGTWSTLGLAAHPHGFLCTSASPAGSASADGLGAFAGDAFHGTADRLRVDLAPDARLDVTISNPVPWPRKSFGGSSVFQAIPALNQYWHPWLLGGSAHGHAVVGAETWDLDGWSVYAEKNWGKGGFPESWWWGQAQGFADPSVCVAFAGGEVTAGPIRTTVTAVVVLLPDGKLIRLGDPLVSAVHAEVSDERWTLHGRSAQWSVEIEGSGSLNTATCFRSPYRLSDATCPEPSSTLVRSCGSLSVAGARSSGKGSRTLPLSNTAVSTAPGPKSSAGDTERTLSTLPRCSSHAVWETTQRRSGDSMNSS